MILEKEGRDIDRPESRSLNITRHEHVSMFYPGATRMNAQEGKGFYPKSYPEGCVIHYTAGQSRGAEDAIKAMEDGGAQGYAYFCISSDGDVFQSLPLSEWGSHAGKSSYPSLDGWVSKYLVGIEVCSAGKLDSCGVSWFGKKFKRDDVRIIRKDTDNVKKGVYQKFTDEQERALTDLIIWLKDNSPGVFNFDLVLGHDEVSPGRKVDPGGCLSKTMPEYREFLKKLYK